MTHPMSHHDKVAKSIDFDLARSGTISNQPHEFPEIFGVPKFATNLGGRQSPPRWGNLLRWRPRDTHTTLAIEGPGGVMPLETRVTVTRGLLIRSVHWPPPKKNSRGFHHRPTLIFSCGWRFFVGFVVGENSGKTCQTYRRKTKCRKNKQTSGENPKLRHPTKAIMAFHGVTKKMPFAKFFTVGCDGGWWTEGFKNMFGL